MTRSSHARRAEDRPRRFARVRAILAGGLVLGVGGSLTMAAWADSEFGQATFTASRFTTESSINSGTSWADSTAAAPLIFAFPAGGMSPSTVKYAPFWVRTKALSLDGTLALQPATNDNATLAGAMRYRVVRYPAGATCGAALFQAGASPAPTAFIVGTPGAAGSATTSVALTSGAVLPTTAVTANQGAATQFCFEVSMNSDAANELQGQSVTPTWEVKASSSS
jgi:predicted ribosomally synthesized peptide with SipW-like signal peptide